MLKHEIIPDWVNWWLLDAALLRSECTDVAPNASAIGIGIVSLLAVLAASAPVLLASDDVHGLDLPSTRALELALRRLVPHPIAVLGTLRLGARTGVNGCSKSPNRRLARLNVS